MRCVEIGAPGGPEALRLAERPIPEPRDGEVLIEVAAAGVNRPDVLQRKGAYRAPPGASDLPGLEVAGTIAGCGAGVAALKEGTRVCALVPGGGYAQYCTTPQEQCLPVPDGLDLIEAASLPEVYFTVWFNLFVRNDVTCAGSLLVHGGSSGIGLCAIQLAVAFGVEVYATAGSAAKCAACERLGAKAAINYHEDDFVEEVRKLTDGGGVDMILDMVGGGYVGRNLELLARGGTLVMIAFLGGSRTEVDMMALVRNQLSVNGSTMRPQPVAVKGEIARQLQERVWPLFATGEIKTVIHETFPLEEAADAHALMESSAHIGKIMLAVKG